MTKRLMFRFSIQYPRWKLFKNEELRKIAEEVSKKLERVVNKVSKERGIYHNDL